MARKRNKNTRSKALKEAVDHLQKKDETAAVAEAVTTPVPGVAAATFSQTVPATDRFWLYGLMLVLFVPTILAPTFSQYGYSPDLHMAFMIQFGMLVLLTVFLFAHRRQREWSIVKNPLNLPVLLFYAWALLSILWAHNRFESTISLLDWLAGVVTFFLVAHGLRKPGDIKLVIQVIFATGILLAFLGWNQYLFNVTWVQQHAPPSATFNNKNMAAQYGVLVMPLGIGLFLAAQSRLAYWFYALTSALVFVFVMYTFTRNTYLNFSGIAIALVLFLVIDRLRGNRLSMARGKILALVVAVCFGLFALMWNSDGWHGVSTFSDVASGVASIGPSSKTDGTGVPRIAMWFNSLHMFRDHWLAGVGMGNWMVYYPLYQASAILDLEMSETIQHINAHNDYVEILSDLGLIGIGLLLFLIYRVFSTALRNFYGYPDNPNRFLIFGVLLGIVGIGINGFFSFPFKQPAPIMVFLAYLGILANDFSRIRDAGVWRPQAGNKILIASLVSAIFAVLIFILHVQWNQSEIHFRKATIASYQQDYHQMKLEGQRSYDALPLRSRMLNFVGMGHLRTGNPKAASEYLERVKASYPHRNNTLQNLGYIYLQLAEEARRRNDLDGYADNLRRALENFSHLTTIRPDNPRAHRNLGITYARLNKPQEAYIHLETSLALDRARGLPIHGEGAIVNLIEDLKARAKS